MKKINILIIFFFLSLSLSFAQTSISGIINQYSEITSIIGSNRVNVSSVVGFSIGDTVLIIQMKGAQINLTNDSHYGDINNYNNAGNYEFLVVQGISSLQVTFTCNMTRSYDVAGLIQLIKVKSYSNAKVVSELTCKAWDENQRTGGVLAFIVHNNLTLNANINVSAKGFKGGVLATNFIHCASDGIQFQRYFYGNNPDSAGMKGEGVFVKNLNYYRGRGKNANGGGGGNLLNAGGGGGANQGRGGDGGKESDWCTSGALSVGGVGGEALLYANNINRVFMGGGGGCGTQELTNDGLPGGTGGGIIIIIANNVIGNGYYMSANGQTVAGVTANESAGGGGAGGCILFGVNIFTGTLNVEAKGGNGGNTSGNCRGPGGGGGAGVIWSALNSLPNNVLINISKGLKGTAIGSCGDWGASDGQSGVHIGKLNIPTTCLGIIPISNNIVASDQTYCAISSVNSFVPSILIGSTPVGGNGFYVYLWQTSNDGINWVDALAPNNLKDYTPQSISVSTYYRRVTVSLSQANISNIVLVKIIPDITNNIISSSQIVCAGHNPYPFNASVPIGGEGNYVYEWYQNTGTGWILVGNALNYNIGLLTQTTQYRRVVKDGICTDTSNIVVLTKNPSINISINKQNITCFGLHNGNAIVTATGGQGSFTYSWQDGTLGQTISNLSTGNYIVTIIDGVGCMDTAKVTILEPTQIAMNSSFENITCFGFNNGSISVDSISGGTPYVNVNQYHYLWSNGSQTSILSGLSQGNYYVTISDSLNCLFIDTFFITEPTQMQILQNQINNISCFGESNGSIDISVDGGSSGYSYNWSNNSSSQDLLNLTIGTYVVTVTDIANCQVQSSFSLIQPNPLTLSFSVDSITCFGLNNGSINTFVTGGTGTKFFQWNNGVQNANNMNIPAGSYSLTVTDFNACFLDTSIVLVEPSLLVRDSIFVKNATCFGDASGSIEVFATGGTPSYSYNWSNGTIGSMNNNLFSGIYICTVSDANACYFTDTIEISQPLIAVSGTISGNKSICEGETTNLFFTFSGNPPWELTYTDGINQFNVNNIYSSTYSLAITPSVSTNYTFVLLSDANQCFASVNNLIGSAAITVYQKPKANAGFDSAICGKVYQLNAISNGQGSWQQLSGAQFDSDTNPQTFVTVDNEGVYSFVWIENNGVCDDRDTVVIEFSKLPLIVSAGDDIDLFMKFEVNLNAIVPDAGIGEWSVIEGAGLFNNKNDPNSLVTGLKLGESVFRWTVTSENCIPKYDDIVVRVDGIKIPSGFSPNADGNNDYFEIEGLKDTQNCKISIFNRWGSELYKSNNYRGDWNGKNTSGEDLPEDTYFYVIQIDSDRYSGYVVIKR